MGRVLQRTSISTNIKERLDFSCAVFGPDGGLVSNAPHIPVHLGAMQETVQYQVRGVYASCGGLTREIKLSRLTRCLCFSAQIKSLGNNLKDGDVILSNHPCAGGSHLPDLTVITPVCLSLLYCLICPSLLFAPFIKNTLLHFVPPTTLGVPQGGQPSSVFCCQQGAPCRHWWDHSGVHATAFHLSAAGGSSLHLF